MGNSTEEIGIPLAVIAPCYNESQYLENFICEWSLALSEINHQFFLIDDGSTDNTESLIEAISKKYPNLCYLKKSNSGHGLSCRFGYDYVLNLNKFSYILQIDSDGQCNPNYFFEFWKLAKENDCVFGIRQKRDDGLLRTLTSFFCTTLSSIICGKSLKDANVPYRLIKTCALQNALKKVPKDFIIQNVALTVALKSLRNVSFGYVPIHFKDRAAGSNSINIFDVTKLGIKMLFELSKLNLRNK